MTQNPDSKSLIGIIKDHPFRACFWGFLGILFVGMPLLSFQFGITWDDWHQFHYGRLVMRWYLSLGADTEALTWSNLQYYGGTFDTITALLYTPFAGDLNAFLNMSRGNDMLLQGLFEMRHCLNAFVGFGIILYAGLLTKRLAGWRAGFLALIFLALSPRFFGHAMNNPKDIPFAFGYIMTIYHLIRFMDQYPFPKKRHLILIVAGIAIAIGVRIAGVFLIGYAWIFILLKWAGFYFGKKDTNISIAKPLAWIAIITLAGYALGIVCWPFALISPVKNPLTILMTLSHLISGDEMMLFEGREFKLSAIPWYYIPKWMAISTPFFFHGGLLLAVFALARYRKQYSWSAITILLTSVAVPLALVIIQRPHLYNSWRHLIFIYPPIVVLMAIGWDCLLKKVTPKLVKYGVSVLLAILCLDPLLWMVRNHPNEYVYFNQLVGGINGARGNYELDYWGNCMREASEWLGDYHRKSNTKAQAIVQSQGSIMGSAYYLYKKLPKHYLPYSSSVILNLNLPPNYYLVLANQLNGKNFDAFDWPKGSVLYQVKADDTTLCAVLTRMK